MELFCGAVGTEGRKVGLTRETEVCWVDKTGKVLLVGGITLGVLRLGEALET